MRSVKKEAVKEEHKQYKTEPWQQSLNPATKVSPEVIQIFRTTKVPKLMIPSHTPIQQAAKIYHTEYAKLFLQNRKLNADLIQTFQERNRLAEKYNELKRQQNDCDDTIRRKRRFANQIKRNFQCPEKNCHKAYGSEGSLTQHVKLKHEDFYKSGQYEILLQRMMDQMGRDPVKKEENVIEVKEETQIKNEFKFQSNQIKTEVKLEVKKEAKIQVKSEVKQQVKKEIKKQTQGEVNKQKKVKNEEKKTRK